MTLAFSTHTLWPFRCFVIVNLHAERPIYVKTHHCIQMITTRFVIIWMTIFSIFKPPSCSPLSFGWQRTTNLCLGQPITAFRPCHFSWGEEIEINVCIDYKSGLKVGRLKSKALQNMQTIKYAILFIHVVKVALQRAPNEMQRNLSHANVPWFLHMLVPSQQWGHKLRPFEFA